MRYFPHHSLLFRALNSILLHRTLFSVSRREFAASVRGALLVLCCLFAPAALEAASLELVSIEMASLEMSFFEAEYLLKSPYLLESPYFLESPYLLESPYFLESSAWFEFSFLNAVTMSFPTEATVRTTSANSILANSTTASRTTTNANALYATNASFNAANIPLLSEPFVDIARFADSLGVRRSDALGGRNGSGVDGIPYNSSQGYSFQAMLEQNSRQNGNQNSNTAAQQSVRKSTGNPATDAASMRIRESLLGTSLRTGAQTYTLDEYVSARNEHLRRGLQDSIMHFYAFRKPLQAELASILTQSSNVSIPFPGNPLTTIFGKPELRLNANIEGNIRLGAAYNFPNNITPSANGQGQLSPLFTQSWQSNISASLGDKFSINLDNNTQRQFEFDNLLRFAYDGEPDEIFRRIEVGNVTLNSPSTFIAGSQALFGVRTDLQFGPVFLKLLYAQKRGQRKVASVKAGAVRQPVQLRAYDYASNNFFINSGHREVWKQYTTSAPAPPTTELASRMRVKEIEVWESTPDPRVQEAAEAVVVANIDSVIGANTAYPPEKYADTPQYPNVVGSLERGRFVRLPESRYFYDQNLGRLIIFNLRQTNTYGIAYRLEGDDLGDDRDITYGTFVRNVNLSRSARDSAATPTTTSQPTDSLLRLQMVYRPNMQPAFTALWQRQMMNVYQLGVQQVKPENTKLDIVYMNPRGNDSLQSLPAQYQSPEKLVTVFGVDKVNNKGSGPADGLMDLHLDYIFNAQRGELVFPSLEPFREGLRSFFRTKGRQESEADTLIYAMVYDTTRDAAKTDISRDRFIISGEVSGSSGNRIQIPNAFNLAPGSVKVKLNNSLLEEYTDYRIEYFTGVVEIINPNALALGANLEIEYEQNDVFQMANKQMMGLRLDLDTKPILRSRDLAVDFGITVMNYNQQVVTERIRLGEEPMDNTMIGADAKFTWNADWITKFLDWLPFYDTKAPSSITGSGEIAWMLPTPNRRASDVISDKGKPAVYIDDFEGAQRNFSLGRQDSQWRFASPPTDATDSIFPRAWGSNPQAVARYRGNLNWFQFFGGTEPIENIAPNRSVIRGGAQANGAEKVLEIAFDPKQRGIYNPNENFRDSLTYLAPANRALCDSILRTNPMAVSTYRSYSRRLGDTTRFTTRDSLLAAFHFDRTQGNRSKFLAETDSSKHIWGGFMRLLSPFNNNFDNDNVEYIEVVMKVIEGESDIITDATTGKKRPKARMYIDLGQISEDFIPNGNLDTEDGILPWSPIINGMITASEAKEDYGLDGIPNSLERLNLRAAADTIFTTSATRIAAATVVPTLFNPNAVRLDTLYNSVRNKAIALNNPDPVIRNETDPSRDDFAFTAQNTQFQFQRDSDFVRYNGVEGSTISDAGKFPDTEILNSNNGQTLMRSDAFFRYEVNLSTERTGTDAQIVNRVISKADNSLQYITYRIPIRKDFIKVGNPLFTNIQYARVFWKGGRIRARIADWRFVGSQWIRQPALLPGTREVDSRLQVGFVGVEDNSGSPEFYTSPPGVQRQTQLGNPDPNLRIALNEQALAITSEGLQAGQEHMVARFFRPFDVFFYRRLRMFFHGKGEADVGVRMDSIAVRDGNADPNRVNQGRTGVLAVLRFGVDTLNYYEYNAPLRKGWQQADIELAVLTSIKGVDSLARRGGLVSKLYPDSSQFIIRGSPTLTRLQYVAIGIRNNGTGQLSEVKLWANELRAIDPDLDSTAFRGESWAAVGNITAKFADVGSMTATLNITKPYFHRLEERFGTRNERTSLNVSSQFTLDRFLPADWAGSSLPITHTYTYSIDKPRFLPQNDIVVSSFVNGESSRERNQTTAQQAGYERFLRQSSETEVFEEQLSMQGVRLNVPIQFFFFTDFFNQLTHNFSYTRRSERSPVVLERSGFNWRAQTQYIRNFAQIPIRPFGWTDSIPEISFLKDWTLYFLPSNISLNVEFNRAQIGEALRGLATVQRSTTNGTVQFDEYIAEQGFFDRLLGRPQETAWRPRLNVVNSPVVRNFDALRQMQMMWKIADNGLLNPTLDWSVSTFSTMLNFETEIRRVNNRDTLVQRSNGEVFGRIFNTQTNPSWLNLGEEMRHTQNFTLNFRPRFPAIMGGNRFLVPTLRYTSAYAWERVFTGSGDTSQNNALNKATRVEAALNGGLTLRLKELIKVILPPEQPQNQTVPPFGANLNDPLGQAQLLTGANPTQQKSDSAKAAANPDSVLFHNIGQGMARFVRTLCDFEQIGFTIQQNSTANNSGILGNRFGGTGFASGIAGLIPQIIEGRGLEEAGPSMAYQLGLVREPHQYLQLKNLLNLFSPNDSVFGLLGGRRPSNAAVLDAFKQNTTLDLRMQRELWQGTILEISSGARNEYRLTKTMITDASGFMRENGRNISIPSNATEFYTFDRTILSVPFFNSAELVTTRFNEYQALRNPGRGTDTTQRRQGAIDDINDAFFDGFDASATPNESAAVRQARKVYLPLAINLAFRWSSLDQFEPLKGILRSGTLEHKYVARYSSTERVTGERKASGEGSTRIFDMQSVTVSFEPLLAINVQFDDKFAEGLLGGSIRYDNKVQYGMKSSQPTVMTQEQTNNITIQGTYTRRGFKLPKIPGLELLKMLGSEVNIENDIEYGLQFSYLRRTTLALDVIPRGTAPVRVIDGTTKITVELSARYTFSKQLTARAFVSYDGNLAEGAAVPGSNGIQLGIDFRLNLSGGRNF